MSRLEVLSLYRRILRLHRQKLPLLHREIGDKYVRQEFRAHRDVTPTQYAQFKAQWEDYAAHLQLEADLFGVGRDLPDDQVEALSDQQKLQLDKLRSSAATVGIQTKTQAGQNPYEDVKPS